MADEILSVRERTFLVKVGGALKMAGLLDAELSPSETLAQARIVVQRMRAEGLDVVYAAQGV